MTKNESVGDCDCKRNAMLILLNKREPTEHFLFISFIDMPDDKIKVNFIRHTNGELSAHHTDSEIETLLKHVDGTLIGEVRKQLLLGLAEGL